MALGRVVRSVLDSLVDSLVSDWIARLQDFHFLRPWWLLGLAIVPVIYFLRRKYRTNSSGWSAALSPELLAALMPKSAIQKLHRIFEIFAFVSAILIVLALAGPCWEQLPQPVDRKDDDLVIVLDLSFSMNAEDIAPSRVVRAKQKVTDILRNRSEGSTALVAYAGDAHVVTPLTNDTNTIEHLVSSLDPSIMPIPGSKTRMALELALELLAKGSTGNGRILVLADDIEDPKELSDIDFNGIPVHVIGIGTEEGGPIPIVGRDGSINHVVDAQENPVIAKLDREKLSALAKLTRGTYSDLALGDNDVSAFFDGGWIGRDKTTRVADREFDQWNDSGYLLLIPIALLIVFGLRKGAVVVFLIALGPTLQADWKDDLWVNRDNQGRAALEEGRNDDAERLFENPSWQAVAKYRSNKFEEAAELFESDDTVRSQFNLGNALAKTGQIVEAIGVYDEVLAEDPDHEDAAFNRDLLTQALQQMQQQAVDEQQGQPSQNENEGSEQIPSESGQEMTDTSEPSEGNGEGSDQSSNADQALSSNQDEPESEQSDAGADSEDSERQEDDSSEQANEDSSEADQPDAASQEGDQREMADAFDRWLRRIPDEPGNLLKAKFQHESIQKLRRGEIVLKESDQRW